MAGKRVGVIIINMVEKEDIQHLADLARIKVTDDEVPKLQKEINAIVDYVSVIKSLTIDSVETKKIGVRYNVLRVDEVSNQSGQYTGDLMKAAPAVDDRGYLKVQQILSTEENNS